MTITTAPVRRRASRSTGSGFTLVELMAVVGIIAILIAILLPVLSKARVAASRTACRAQLADIGRLFQMYLNDTKGRVMRVNPLPSVQPPLPSNADLPAVVEVFDPYTKNVRAGWRCPADVITVEYPTSKPETRTYFEREGTSYEYNAFINARHGWDQWQDVLTTAKKRGVTADRLWIFKDFENFHQKRGVAGSTNFLFADWHVGDFD